MKIWTCKIGEVWDLPDGADAPMRQAVQDAYVRLTGEQPTFLFSGWGAELSTAEAEVVRPSPTRDTPPDPALLRTSWTPWKLDDGREIYLITPEHLRELPDGTTLVSIMGDSVVKGRDNIDGDTRGHFLAFGLEQKPARPTPQEKSK